MAVRIVKKINYSAPLPDDFYALRNLINLSDGKCLALSQFPCPEKKLAETFMIGKDKIYFPGDYSRWVVIKWLQKLKESLFPIKYRLEYFSINETKTGY